MEPFKEATYEQLQRVINVIDRTKPREQSRTGIPSIGYLEGWVNNEPDHNDLTLEQSLAMWENAEVEEE
jgi:hypothetical protein